jgi:hypothetical protein
MRDSLPITFSEFYLTLSALLYLGYTLLSERCYITEDLFNASWIAFYIFSTDFSDLS